MKATSSLNSGMRNSRGGIIEGEVSNWDNNKYRTPIVTEIVDDNVETLFQNIDLSLNVGPKEPYEFVRVIGGSPLTRLRRQR